MHFNYSVVGLEAGGEVEIVFFMRSENETLWIFIRTLWMKFWQNLLSRNESSYGIYI